MRDVNLKNDVVVEDDNFVKRMDLNRKDKLLFTQDSKSGIFFCKPNLKND